MPEMRAVLQLAFGPPTEVLRLGSAPVPQMAPGEVLVEVRAVGLNPADVFLTVGRPGMLRLAGRPRRIPGHDLAGVVRAVGPEVSWLQPGDEVFGEATQTLAEYASVPADRLGPKPRSLTFAEAASLPMVGLTALRALQVASVGAGTRLLVNGAAGGIGTVVVQLATALGAEVTGVCSTRNTELVASLGAKVVDYTAADFTTDGCYDVILDNVLNRKLRHVLRVLAPRGVLLLNSGNGGAVLGPLPRMAHGALRSLMSRRTIRAFTVSPSTRDLVVLRDHVESGELRPMISRTYPLADVAAALAEVATGHVAGKVVVTLE